MNNTQKVWAGIGLAVVLSVVGLFTGSGATGQAGRDGRDGTNGVDGQSLGAVTGPDSTFPCESHNGVTTCFERKNLAQATTTVCAIKSPTATSTLTFASVHINVATGTASTIQFSKAATAFATTTLIYTDAGGSTIESVGALAEVNAFASSTQPKTVRTFSPNTFFVASRAGGGAFAGGVFNEAGYCQATFNVLTP